MLRIQNYVMDVKTEDSDFIFLSKYLVAVNICRAFLNEQKFSVKFLVCFISTVLYKGKIIL